MNTITKILGSILAVVVILFGVVYVNNIGNDNIFGSIQDGQAYTATTTDYTWSATSPQGRIIKTGSGTLGSIVIGNATAVGTITLYDATTTVNGSLFGTTTLAVINTGSLSGTYTYDVGFGRGLLAVMSSTLATSTITFR